MPKVLPLWETLIVVHQLATKNVFQSKGNTVTNTVSHRFTHLCSVDNYFLQICLSILHAFSITGIEVIWFLLLNVVGGITGGLIVFPYKHHVSVCLLILQLNSYKELWFNLYLTVFNERTHLSFAVNRTSFTTTNSMSLSTHHLWHSLHTTSPQYVVRVCIILILWVWLIRNDYCYTSNFFYMLQVVFLPASKWFLLSFFSTEKSAAVGCCSMQSIDRVFIAALGEPRRGMCSITGERNKLHGRLLWRF